VQGEKPYCNAVLREAFLSRQSNGRAYDMTCSLNAGARACDELELELALEHVTTVPQ
jgi:hypothetical protein